MPTYDLVIRGGTVVDGTGLPRRRADVGIKDGRIIEVGFVPGDSPWLIQLFARVEGMDASALEGIPFDGFETFPEYLAHMEGRLGINAAFYVGHCAVRRYVMGDDCQTREATPEE